MALVAFAISLFVAALGVLGIFSPPQLVDVVRHFQTPAGLYAAAALRLNQTTQDWYTSSGADVGATPCGCPGAGQARGPAPTKHTSPGMYECPVVRFSLGCRPLFCCAHVTSP